MANPNHLSARLLPHNLYFRQECEEIRGSLGIPSEGLGVEEALSGQSEVASQERGTLQPIEPELATGHPFLDALRSTGLARIAADLITRYNLPRRCQLEIELYILTNDGSWLETAWAALALGDVEVRYTLAQGLSITMKGLSPFVTAKEWQSLFEDRIAPRLKGLQTATHEEGLEDRYDRREPPNLERDLWLWRKVKEDGLTPWDAVDRWNEGHPSEEVDHEAGERAVRRMDRRMRPRPPRRTPS